MRRRNTISTVCALILLGGLVGCGGSSSGPSGSSGASSGSSDNGVASKSASEIVTAATQAIDAVHSVHVSGSNGSGSAPITLDLELVSGQGGRGQISISGASMQIVSIGQVVYIKAGADFWSRFGNQRLAQAFAGKWLKAPATGKFASFAAFTNLTRLFDQLLSSHGTLAKGATSTVGGQRAVAINDTTKGGTLYVATTGKPYPLKIVKGGSHASSVAFDRINQPVSLSVPAGSIAIAR